MRRLAKNLILATATVSAIFFVDLACAEAASFQCEQFCIKKICPTTSGDSLQYLDFWGKFRDTVMPDPDEPQNNNPPKEMEKPKPSNPKPAKPPKSAEPKPAEPRPAD